MARGDLTRDGVPDTIVGTGPGGQALIRAYNGTSQGLIGTLVAFEPTFTGGVNVAVGDITGDGVVDIIAGAASGTPRVRIFNGANGALLFDFVPFAIAGMSGVEVAAGDVNGDGLADLILGGGAGAEPWVKVYNAANAAVLHNFLAYPAAFRGGVFVAAGDVDADGRADIVTGPGIGRRPARQGLWRRERRGNSQLLRGRPVVPGWRARGIFRREQRRERGDHRGGRPRRATVRQDLPRSDQRGAAELPGLPA